MLIYHRFITLLVDSRYTMVITTLTAEIKNKCVWHLERIENTDSMSGAILLSNKTKQIWSKESTLQWWDGMTMIINYSNNKYFLKHDTEIYLKHKTLTLVSYKMMLTHPSVKQGKQEMWLSLNRISCRVRVTHNHTFHKIYWVLRWDMQAKSIIIN